MDVLGLQSGAPLPIPSLVFNLFIGIILSLLLRAHFERYSSTLSNRQQFSQVFPFIVLTTCLIISIVKSSLALSLGLVGALSIVRFRTPIKEPEELAYLFVAISIGLGLGADQTIAVIVASVIILTMVAILKVRRRKHENRNLYLSLDWQGEEPAPVNTLNEIVAAHTTNSDLRRYDSRQHGGEAVYFVDLPDSDALARLTTALKEKLPTTGITFIDQNHIPSV